MADNLTLNSGSGGASLRTDDVASVHYPVGKVDIGGDGVSVPWVAGQAAMAASAPVVIASNQTAVPVSDSSGSLTVDAPVGTPVFVRLSDGTAAIATLPVSGTVTANLAAGVNNIGDVDVLTLPALVAGTANIGDVDVLTLPAIPTGSNTIGAVTGPTADNAANPTLKLGTLPGVALAVAPLRTEGNVNPLRLNLAGDVAVTLDSEAVVLGAGTAGIGKLTANTGVDIGSVAVLSIAAGTNNIGDVDVLTLPVLPAGTNNIGDVDVLTVPADPFGANADAASATGSISAKLRFIAATGIPITGTVTVGSHAVTNAGTFAVQAASAGDVAHDAADSGNPVKIGAKVETSPKGLTLPADADRTDVFADSDGQLIVKLGTSGADFISESVSNTDGASTAFTNFSAVVSTKNAVTAYSIFRTDAGTSMAYVDFRDGTAGAVLWRVPLPPSGGANLSLGGLPIFKTSANTALAYDVSGALTTVFISVSGFQTKV